MEVSYLALLRKIMAEGEERSDRTGVGTKALFGEQLRCNLADGFPLLTTKRLPFRHLVAELLWFISGSTDARVLQRDGVKIWDGNSSEEFLRARGLKWCEGDIGPGYGFQWRHFGAEYTGCESNYDGKGTDQLRDLIAGLRADPHGRRHFLSAWNPAQTHLMALPPCHLSAQFYIGGNGALSCQMYQRSADAFLGLPWNIASYALLTHIIAAILGRPVGDLIMCLGDVHIYSSHFAAVKEQLERKPCEMPRILVECTSIDAIEAEKITLIGYNPAPAIRAPMAV